MDKCREQFEEWATSQKSFVTKENGDYINPYVGYAWQAWQASRQALVVELPRVRGDIDYGYEQSEIIDLLDSAGSHLNETKQN